MDSYCSCHRETSCHSLCSTTMILSLGSHRAANGQSTPPLKPLMPMTLCGLLIWLMVASLSLLVSLPLRQQRRQIHIARWRVAVSQYIWAFRLAVVADKQLYMVMSRELRRQQEFAIFASSSSGACPHPSSHHTCGVHVGVCTPYMC